MCFLFIKIKTELKKGIRQLVETYQLEVRLTPNQDLLLCNIGDHQKSSVKRDLDALDIETNHKPTNLDPHAIACPALPLCGLAITEAERYLPKVIARIENQLQELKTKKKRVIM